MSVYSFLAQKPASATDSLHQRLQTLARLMCPTKNREVELGGRIFSRTAEAGGYVWELARDFDQANLCDEDDAL